MAKAKKTVVSASEQSNSYVPSMKTIQVPFTEEDRQSGIESLEEMGLAVCSIQELKDSSGNKVWEIVGKNLNAALRPGLQFAD